MCLRSDRYHLVRVVVAVLKCQGAYGSTKLEVNPLVVDDPLVVNI